MVKPADRRLPTLPCPLSATDKEAVTSGDGGLVGCVVAAHHHSLSSQLPQVANNDFLHTIDGDLGELKTGGLKANKAIITQLEYGFLSMFPKTKPRKFYCPGGTKMTASLIAQAEIKHRLNPKTEVAATRASRPRATPVFGLNSQMVESMKFSRPQRRFSV